MAVEAMVMRLDDKLPEWIAASLITEQQARAIREHEGQEPALIPHGRVPLATEALGYLGAGLSVAALITLLAQDWSTYPLATRLAVPLLAAVLLAAAGLPLGGSREPAYARFGSVLWLLAVASTAWFMAVFADEVIGASGPAVAAWAAGVAGLSAVIFYVARREPLQLIAMAITGAAFVTNVVTVPFDPSDAEPWIGISLWIAAMVWLVLTWRGVLTPAFLAYALGGFAAIQAAAPIAQTEGIPGDLGLALGVATAAGMIAASIWLRSDVLLAFGVLGAFLYLTQSVRHFFGDSIGMPLVLLTTGVILLAVAYLSMRLRRPPGHHPPAAHPA